MRPITQPHSPATTVPHGIASQTGFGSSVTSQLGSRCTEKPSETRLDV
jgi:hypothetical protein